jgi:hypothetical protein
MPMQRVRPNDGISIKRYWEIKSPSKVDRSDEEGCITIYKLPKHFSSYLDVIEHDLAMATSSRKETTIKIECFGLVLLHRKEYDRDLYAEKFKSAIEEIEELRLIINTELQNDEDKKYWLTEPNKINDLDKNKNKFYVGAGPKRFINDTCAKKGYDKYTIVMML